MSTARKESWRKSGSKPTQPQFPINHINIWLV
jgi:hypothetical protein